MQKLLFFSASLFMLLVLPASASTHLSGTIIALDAGHGGAATGAVNQTYGVLEKDVNLDVVLALKTLLENEGAQVVLTREEDETIASRKERVSIAKEKCEALGGECDILISVHHNGSSDTSVDYTQVFVTQKKDKALGIALHDTLQALTGDGRGVKNDGYGMTVHGGLVSALTESYFITNDTEAELYLFGDRVGEEAALMLEGIENYFAGLSDGGNGGNCSPGKQKQGKC